MIELLLQNGADPDAKLLLEDIWSGETECSECEAGREQFFEAEENCIPAVVIFEWLGRMGTHDACSGVRGTHHYSGLA